MNDAVAEADAAEADLYRLLAPRVRRYGLRHQRDTHAADYLMQNVMALTLEHLRGGQVRQPDRERSVLVMMFYEDKPSEVVTSMLGLTSGNVRVLLHRGTAALPSCGCV